MARTVWKSAVSPDSTTQKNWIELPQGSEVLAGGPDGSGQYCVWALVDPDMPKVRRQVLAVGTGEKILSDTTGARHLATILDGSGAVTHLFVMPEEGAARKN